MSVGSLLKLLSFFRSGAKMYLFIQRFFDLPAPQNALQHLPHSDIYDGEELLEILDLK